MKKSTKIIRLSVTLLLLIAMLLTPMSPVFAVVIENGDADLTAADIVSEDASKREKFSRHYLTGDGTYFAVSYAEQVNYQDEDGNWIAVDNSLSTNVLTGEKTTKNDKFKVKFANKANKDDLVSIQTNDYKVSFGITVSEDGESYLELNKVKGTENPGNTSAEPKTTQEATSLGKAVSGITYVDAFSDYLDVRYSVAHEKVKEDLILERKSGFNSYKVTYNIKEKDALATLNDDGSITFTNPDGAVLFNVGVPVMYDSDGKSSADIAVSMTQTKKTVEVTYTPSADWLNAEDRVYPVTIDPTVFSDKYYWNYYDSSICYSIPYENPPGTNAPIVHMDQDNSYLIWIFNLPTLSAGDYVTDAYLKIYASNWSTTDSNGYITVNKLGSDWSPGDIIDEYGGTAYPTVTNTYTIPYSQAIQSAVEEYLINIEIQIGSDGYDEYVNSNYGYELKFSPGDATLNVYSSYCAEAIRPYFAITYDSTLPYGSYYFRNYNCNQFLTRSSESSLNGNQGLTVSFDKLICSDSQQFTIENVQGNYYRIRYSGQDLCVSNNYLSLNQNPTVSHYWQIIKKDSKKYSVAYVGTSLDAEPTKSLAIEYDEVLNIYKPRLVTYSTTTNDEYMWEIHQDIDAVILGLSSLASDSILEEKKQIIAPKKDGIVYSSIFTDYTASEMISIMKNTEIFIIYTHGSSNGIQISNSSTMLTNVDISDETFYNIDFAFLISCSTGSSNVTLNFMDYLLSSYVSAVAGFTEPVNSALANPLANAFLAELFTNEKSIQEAEVAIDANTNAIYSGILSKFVTKGTTSQKLVP